MLIFEGVQADRGQRFRERRSSSEISASSAARFHRTAQGYAVLTAGKRLRALISPVSVSPPPGV